jgi:RpiR family transcriptional regulator, carbohydrate utilization regulator
LTDVLQELAGATLAAEGAVRQVARWLLDNQERAAELSISELAAQTGVSETTVFRFCRQMGFTGYRDLRVALVESRGLARGVQMLMPEIAVDGEGGEQFATIARRIVELNAEVLRDTLRLVDPAMLERATEALLAAKHVRVLGFGSSSPVASDAYQRLLRLGIAASAHSDPHVIAALTANPLPETLFFGITYSGQTRDLVEALETAGERGSQRLVLTSNPRGKVTEVADIVLVSSVRRTPVTQESIATRISQLAIIDMLCVGIALKHPRKLEFIHEGALQEREIAKKRVPDEAKAAPQHGRRQGSR